MRTRHVLASFAGLLLAACTNAPEAKKEVPAEVKKEAPAEAKQESKSAVPDVFKVRFTTSKGPFVVEAHREWAPLGVERFYQLVKDGYFNEARFFRVVPNFVVQFGIAANPKTTKKWDNAIQDDPVLRTNRQGSLTFATAGRNTRTTQLFINLRSNQSLDADGFAPFAQVIEGMNVVTSIYAGYGEQPDQEAITKRGNAYLNEQFPNLDYIKTAVVE
jgi:peptidyl-prolyl cis-trans isomerase A (cyclophilin A)